jgi:hypothetical protein
MASDTIIACAGHDPTINAWLSSCTIYSFLIVHAMFRHASNDDALSGHAQLSDYILR